MAVLVTIAALWPEKWRPGLGLGWRIDHFVGYLVITARFCLACPQTFVAGGSLMAGAPTSHAKSDLGLREGRFQV